MKDRSSGDSLSTLAVRTKTISSKHLRREEDGSSFVVEQPSARGPTGKSGGTRKDPPRSDYSVTASSVRSVSAIGPTGRNSGHSALLGTIPIKRNSGKDKEDLRAKDKEKNSKDKKTIKVQPSARGTTRRKSGDLATMKNPPRRGSSVTSSESSVTRCESSVTASSVRSVSAIGPTGRNSGHSALLGTIPIKRNSGKDKEDLRGKDKAKDKKKKKN
eukprot:GHVP01065804.1.p1 GENE.GHVP01065804.1~~GHVP01065804.1.p1  ORF type:complete len:216 (+),score=27.09 GHVP01065804.1:237-884(+)